MSPESRDLGLQPLSARIDRARTKLCKPEPAPLVEPQRINVVVRRDHPQPPAAGVPRELLHRRKKRRSGPGEPNSGMQGQDFAGVTIDRVRRRPDQSAL